MVADVVTVYSVFSRLGDPVDAGRTTKSFQKSFGDAVQRADGGATC